MLTAEDRRLQELDPNLDAPLDPALDPALVPEQTLDGALSPVRRPLYRPEGEVPGQMAPQAADTTPSNPTDNTGGITQLPDGSGGMVNVPPVSMAPPSVFAPTATPTDMGVTPLANPYESPAFTPQAPTDYAPSIPDYGGSGSAPPIQDAPPQSDGGAAMPFTPPSARAADPAPQEYGDLTGGPIQDVPSPAPAAIAPQAQAPYTPPPAQMGPPPPMDTAPPTPPVADLTPQRTALAAMLNAPKAAGSGNPADWAKSIPIPVTPPTTPGSASPTPPGTSGAQGSGSPTPLGKFTAENNLIDSQILPTADPRLINLQGMSDTALGKVTNGPDRLALAKQYLEASNSDASQQYDHDLTDATRRGASSGILGSGMLTNKYGDLFSGLQRSRDANRLRYLTDASSGTIGDNLNAYDAASGAASRAFGEGVTGRNEVRGERGYQRSVAEQAVAARIAENQAEEQGNQREFNNAFRLYDAGNDNNPTGAYQRAAGQASGEAGASADMVREFLRMMTNRRQSAGG